MTANDRLSVPDLLRQYLLKMLDGAASVPGSSNVSVVNTPTVTVTNPTATGLTDTQLRAAPVPVSGTVAVSNPTSNPETGLAKDATLTNGTQITQVSNFPSAVADQLIHGPVSITNPTANPETGLTKEVTLQRRFGNPGTPKKAQATLLSTSGNNDFITPTTGKAIRILWVAFVPNSDNTAANLVQIKFGAAGASLYLGYALAHWEVFEGAVDQHVFVNLSNTQPVAVTIHYEEF